MKAFLAFCFAVQSAVHAETSFRDFQGFHPVPKSVGLAIGGRLVTVPFTNTAQFITVDGITAGCYTRTIGPKQTVLVANQLATMYDYIRVMFQNCPTGSVVLTPALYALAPSPSESGGVSHGPWAQNIFDGEHFNNDMERFPRGTGALFKNPTTNTLTLFFGGRLTDFTNYIPAAYSITCSPQPKSGTIDELGFPKAVGDVVHKLDLVSQKFIHFTNTASGWSPSVPSFEIGEAFAVDKVNAAVWTISK